MKMLCPLEVGIQTYHFKFPKTISVSSFRVMFRVHHSIKKGLGPLHYYVSQQDLSKGLLSDPNGDCMKTL